MNISKIRIHFNEMDKFPIKIGVLNTLSYLAVVLSVTYVDSSYNHITYGVRHYPLGYSVGWFAVIIFCLTIIINSSLNLQKEYKAVCTFLAVIVPNIFINYINFQPEFPHAIVIFGSIMYEVIILFIVYIHNIELGFKFVDQGDISQNAKIERLKIDYDIWQKFLLALIAGVSAWILTWLQGVRDVGPMVSEIPIGQELVRTHIIFLTSIASFLSLLLISEVVKKILKIRDQFEKIKI